MRWRVIRVALAFGPLVWTIGAGASAEAYVAMSRPRAVLSMIYASA